jgi:hypothetical protein
MRFAFAADVLASLTFSSWVVLFRQRDLQGKDWAESAPGSILRIATTKCQRGCNAAVPLNGTRLGFVTRWTIEPRMDYRLMQPAIENQI